MVSMFFFLKTERKYADGTCPLFFQISFNGCRIRRPVQGVRLLPSDWDNEKHLVKKARKGDFDNNFQEYNTRIRELQSKVAEINKYIFLNKIRVTEKFILDRLEDSHRIDVDKRVFIPVFEDYLNAIRPNSTHRTILGKTTVLNFLRDFEKYRKEALHLSEFDKTMFEELRRYAYEQRNIGVNYFAKIITTLKTFLQWAQDKGLHDTTEFKKFSAPEKETEVIYLTLEELQKLFRYDFKSPRLDRVRDIYCFCCFTGLRISDAISLRPAHIQNGQVTKVIEKTKEQSVIPLNSYALEILSKYKGTIHEPLPKISGQKLNEYIKECCEKAEINAPTTIVRFSGGKREESVLPKYEVITSHTARKTFATNSLILGMKEMIVRNITGHKKEESFRRYVKIADKVKVEEMARTWDKVFAE